MSSRKVLTEEIENAWIKLHNGWQGKDADNFHQKYIVQMSESVDGFEDACDELKNLSSDLARDLQLIELSLTN